MVFKRTAIRGLGTVYTNRIVGPGLTGNEIGRPIEDLAASNPSIGTAVLGLGDTGLAYVQRL